MAADLLTLAEERAYGALESAWLESVEGAARSDIAAHLAAAEALASQNEPERAATLLQLLVPPLKAEGRTGEALRVARRAVDLASRPEELRGDLVGLLRAANSDRPGFEAYLKMSGLGEREPVRAAVAKLEGFLDYPIGRHVYHAAGWGVGRVVDVDKRTGDLTIDFEKKKGHILPIDSAQKFLQRLPDDHIWSLKYSSADRLKLMIEQTPGDLVKAVVRSRPDRKANITQVKQELSPSLMPEKQWSKFWARAKAELLHDPLVAISDDTRPVISIRAEAVRFSDEVRRKVAKLPTLEAATAAARQFLRQAQGGPAGKIDAKELEDVCTTLAGRLTTEAAKSLKERPGAAVEALFLIEDFVAAGVKLDGAFSPGSPLEPVVAASKSLDRFVETARGFDEGAYLRRYVERARKENAGFATRFAAAMPTAPKEVIALCVGALKESDAALLGKTVAKIVSTPDPDPDVFLELAKHSFGGKLDGVPGAPDRFQVLERLLAYADRVERLRSGGAPNAPNLKPRVRSLLEDEEYRVVSAYFKDADKEACRHLYQRIMTSHAIDDEVREVARGVVVRRMPELLSGNQRRFFWDEETQIFTTRAGLKKYEAEFQELANVKIPANARAIGAAAALGDLSENAEFTAALEERNQLVARADRMKKDLERARVLEETSLEEGLIGPGMRAELRNAASGKAETYTILGPWDVDLEHGVISYTAPLAKGLLGRKVGERVEVVLPGGQRTSYDVIRIERAI
jgi:transcription elongation factor GreA